jgi:hypothetical protein
MPTMGFQVTLTEAQERALVDFIQTCGPSFRLTITEGRDGRVQFSNGYGKWSVTPGGGVSRL